MPRNKCFKGSKEWLIKKPGAPGVKLTFARDAWWSNYSAGTEWCSCTISHRPSIFRRPMVNL